MEGFFVLLGLIPIALVVLLIVNLTRMRSLQNDVRAMRTQMQDVLKQLSRTAQQPTATSAVLEPPPSPRPVAPSISGVPIAPPAPVVPRAPEPPIIPALPVPPVQAEPVRDLHEEVRKAAEERERTTTSWAARAAAQRATEPPPLPPPHKPGFLERNPDLEKFIGENLINKIGIAILVIGLGLLLKFAIAKDYLNETAQTLIGVGSGALLIFFAHRLREKFRAFSSVLVGGGLSVLYFTIAIAFQQFHLLGQTAAFITMLTITGIGVLLTLVYDRRELAVIALLGGFASPFMASSGAGSYQVLFSYLLILDAGMLVLASFKKWHIINVISFVLTALIVGGWIGMRYPTLDPRPVWPVFLFVSGFFLVFFSMNLRYNLRHNGSFGPLDFSLLLANTAAYYGASMVLLNDLPVRMNGLFTLVLALFHLVFAWLFFKRTNVPRHLVFLLIGLVLTFVSLAAPVQLQGNHITLFWSAECVLLLWLSQRTGIRLVERASVLVAMLMLISLSMDLAQHYASTTPVRLTPLLNKPWITGMGAAMALWSYAFLLRSSTSEPLSLPGFQPLTSARERRMVLALMGLVLFTVNFLEINHQLGYLFDPSVVTMALSAYTLLALSVFFFLLRGAPSLARWALAGLFGLVLLIHITGFYDSAQMAVLDLRTGQGGYASIPFHLAASVAAIIALVCATQLARSLLVRPSRSWNVYLWGMGIYLVIFFSQELDHVLLLFLDPVSYAAPGEPADGTNTAYGLLDALRSARKGAYPILWGLGSFVAMWYGMRTRLRMVRVFALTLFGVTLVKLFLFDIQGVSEGGKVAAFICLGVLLLVVSFMYNKLKGLLLEKDRSVPTELPNA